MQRLQRSLAALAAACALTGSGAAFAQGTPVRDPQVITPQVSFAALLDQVRSLADQGKLDEAREQLQRALAALDQLRGLRPAADTAPLRVGGGVLEPKNIYKPKPIYPAEAIAAKVQGVVYIELVVA